MRKKIFWILRAAISAGLIYYIFRIIPYEKVVISLKSANVLYIILAVISLQILNYLAAAKYTILTDKQNMTLTTWDIFKINYYTKFYDLFLPQVLSGGVIRWYIISKNDKMPAQALASMVFNRYTDLQLLSILGLVFWVLDKPPNPNEIIGITLAGLVTGMILIHFILFNAKVSKLIIRILDIFPYIPGYFKTKIKKVLTAVLNYRTLSKYDMFNILAFNLAKHLTGIFAYYLFALSLDLNINYTTLGWIRTIILLVCTLPISISGIGVREGSLLYMLGVYGITSVSAVAFSFLLYFGSIVSSLIGGIFIAYKLLFTEKKNELGKLDDRTQQSS